MRRKISHKLRHLKSDITLFCKLVDTFRAQSGFEVDQSVANCYSEGRARYDSLHQAIDRRLMQCNCVYHDVRLLLGQLGPRDFGSDDSGFDCLRLFISVPWSGTLQWTSVEIEPDVSTNLTGSGELTKDNIDSMITLK
jgi:hypothetical protein